MAFTQQQLDKLEDAIAQGVLEVQYQDKKVTYRSLDEMMRVRDRIRESLGKASTKSNRTYFKTSKGFE